MKQEFILKSKENHLYSDYLEYIKHHDVNVVQMDCVEGIKEDRAALLTLHFPVLVCSLPLS